MKTIQELIYFCKNNNINQIALTDILQLVAPPTNKISSSSVKRSTQKAQMPIDLVKLLQGFKNCREEIGINQNTLYVDCYDQTVEISLSQFRIQIEDSTPFYCKMNNLIGAIRQTTGKMPLICTLAEDKQHLSLSTTTLDEANSPTFLPIVIADDFAFFSKGIVPSNINKENTITLKVEDATLYYQIAATFINDKDSRRVLRHCYFMSREYANPALIATDGKIMLRMDVPSSIETNSCTCYIKMLVSYDLLMLLKKLKVQSFTLYNYDSKTQKVVTNNGFIIHVTNNCDIQYPDIDKVIPSTNDSQITFNFQQLLSITQEVHTFCKSNKASIMKIKVDSATPINQPVALSAEARLTTNDMILQRNLTATTLSSMEPCQLWFNTRFLLPFLTFIDKTCKNINTISFDFNFHLKDDKIVSPLLVNTTILGFPSILLIMPAFD